MRRLRPPLVEYQKMPAILQEVTQLVLDLLEDLRTVNVVITTPSHNLTSYFHLMQKITVNSKIKKLDFLKA